MAHDDPQDPSIDDIDPLGTLETLDGIGVIDDDDSNDDIQTVDPTELMEPLVASDVIELDYDEDIPTRVDDHRHEQRRETYPPAHVDAKDIFYLTDEHRPSLTLTAEDHVNISEVLQAPPLPKLKTPLPPVHPPPMRTTLPPTGARSSQASSIAPVAMSSEHDEPAPVPVERIPGRGVYGSVVVVLAAAAAIIALWPSDNPSNSIETLQTIAQPAAAALVNTSNVSNVAPEPVLHELEVVEVIADARMVAGVGEMARPEYTGVRPAPPSAPSEEVVIDDAAQLNGVVFPSGEKPSLAPPQPPANDPLPFDTGAAAAAMGTAADMAKTCRTAGMPQSTATVSVTFAPSGRVTTAVVDGDRLSGTAAGGCIARTFRTLRVDPFSGPPVTLHKTFRF